MNSYVTYQDEITKEKDITMIYFCISGDPVVSTKMSKKGGMKAIRGTTAITRRRVTYTYKCGSYNILITEYLDLSLEFIQEKLTIK